MLKVPGFSVLSRKKEFAGVPMICQGTAVFAVASVPATVFVDLE